MNEKGNTQAQAKSASDREATSAGTVITRLAELPERTILDEVALAETVGVSKRTVRRMVGRHELPPPVRFAGRSCWQVGRVLVHFEAKAERAAKETERAARRVRKFLEGLEESGKQNSSVG